MQRFEEERHVFRGSPLEIAWQRRAMEAALSQGAIMADADEDAWLAMLKRPQPSPPAPPIADSSAACPEFRTPTESDKPRVAAEAAAAALAAAPSEPAAAAAGVSVEAATAPKQQQMEDAEAGADQEVKNNQNHRGRKNRSP